MADDKRAPAATIESTRERPRARAGRARERLRPSTPVVVRPRPLAAAEQLGPLGRRRSRRPATRRSTPGWPDDPETVEEANAHPEVFAGQVGRPGRRPRRGVIRGLTGSRSSIGHSFGGLLTQIVAGRGSRPPPSRSTRRRSAACCRCRSRRSRRRRRCSATRANRHRAVPLTYEQFRYAFANAVAEEEAKELYEDYAVPGSGTPIFQAAAANLNPWTEAKVDTKNPERGPLLIVSGEKDHTSRGRSPARRTRGSGATRASPSSSRCPAAATR